MWIIGVKHFIVEVDAQYIKGMINNPDIQPNASLNCWLAGIQTFDFVLCHVPTSHHRAPDGLSCRRRADGDTNEETKDDVDDWIDKLLGYEVWIARGVEKDEFGGMRNEELCAALLMEEGERGQNDEQEDPQIPADNATKK